MKWRWDAGWVCAFREEDIIFVMEQTFSPLVGTGNMQAGYRVGQFVLERPLGQGGMAEVWLGRHEHLGSLAAVKFLREQYLGNPEIVDRFLNEGRRQGSLDHPNIVKVFGFEVVEGRHFLVQQFVDGEALDVRLRRVGGLTVEQALPIAYGVLAALECAHSRQIVHRDVKPGNILIDRQGTPYLTDFGIVLAVDETRQTQAGMTLGTPAYMSPEQAASPFAVDQRADIYSFGCMLTEMLRGAAVPLAVQQVVARCMAQDAAQRYSSCAQVRAALVAATAGGGKGKKRGSLGLWVGGALALLGLAGVALWPRQPVLASFTVSAGSVVSGQAVELRWDVRDATEVEILGIGTQPAKGTLQVKPERSTVYALTGRNRWKSVSGEVAVDVKVLAAAVVQKFEFSKGTVRPGEESTLRWVVTGATSVVINGTTVKPAGEFERKYLVKSRYTLQATGEDGRVVERVAEVLVEADGVPLEIVSFRFNPERVVVGGAAELVWEVRGAKEVTLGGEPARMAGSEKLTNVQRNWDANLVAIGADGQRVARRVTLEVVRQAEPARVRILSFATEAVMGSIGPYAKLQYEVTGATRVRIDPVVGDLTALRGTVAVYPTRTTRYTLTAYGANGESYTRTVEVRVIERAAGKSWDVLHHNPGCRNGFCGGVLTARDGRLVFRSDKAGDGFDVAYSEVVEVMVNKQLFGNMNGFHVRTRTRNFNFAQQAPADAVVREINREIGRY